MDEEKQRILTAYRGRSERTRRRLWGRIPGDFRQATCFGDFRSCLAIP